MQRRTRDGRSREQYGIEIRDRCQSSSAADLDLNIEKLRRYLSSWIFISDRPSRSLGRRTKILLQGCGIDLYHHAVDLVIELVANGFHLLDEVNQVAILPTEFDMWIYVKSVGREPFEILKVRRKHLL